MKRGANVCFASRSPSKRFLLILAAHETDGPAIVAVDATGRVPRGHAA